MAALGEYNVVCLRRDSDLLDVCYSTRNQITCTPSLCTCSFVLYTIMFACHSCPSLFVLRSSLSLRPLAAECQHPHTHQDALYIRPTMVGIVHSMTLVATTQVDGWATKISLQNTSQFCSGFHKLGASNALSIYYKAASHLHRATTQATIRPAIRKALVHTPCKSAPDRNMYICACTESSPTPRSMHLCQPAIRQLLVQVWSSSHGCHSEQHT